MLIGGKMRRLYVDFDGVILDTVNLLYKMYDDVGMNPKDKNPEKINERQIFTSKIDWNKLIKSAPQINDSIDCIQKIIDSEKYLVSILTHVNSLDEAIAKVNFIRKYFDNITVIPVPRKISKTKMVYSKDAILIDDYAGNLREWQATGGIGIRFSTKLNGKSFPVINRLDQILDIKI